MTRWWGPAHAHQAITDMNSLGVSIAATLAIICIASFTIRALRRRKLRLSTGHTL